MTQPAGAISNIAVNLVDALIQDNRGDHHAFDYGSKRYSFQDVAALMNRTGNMLKALGVGRGDRVLLLLPGSPALVASLLGAIKAGAVPVIGVDPGNAGEVTKCIEAVRPAQVVVHQDRLKSLEAALAGAGHDAIVVVGTETAGYKSFVDEVRSQPSSLIAESVGAAAPALASWSGSGLSTTTHAELGNQLASRADPESASAGVLAMLRAFSKGEEATLP